MEHKSPRSLSPSASSGFLRLGRRGSKTSLTTTRTERENKDAALDQIHNVAYQSDSLTHFNDFTSPPTPVSAQDDKGLSEELQGGLTGLYTRFRTSVGGMRDIVSGGTRPTDKNAAESPQVKSPPPERSMSKSVSDLAAHHGDVVSSHPASSQGSRLHSPVMTNFQHTQESAPPTNNGKSSKISSKSASISSKASIPPSPGIKGSIAPLTKSNTGSAAVDPAITQLHANADHRSRSSSVNVPSHGLKNAESASIGSRDGPVDLSLSQTSSVLSQIHPHSPVLSTKAHESIHEDHDSVVAAEPAMSASQVSGTHTRKPSASADLPSLPENMSQSALSRSSKQSDTFKETASHTQEIRSNSRMSFKQDEPATIAPTPGNAHSKFNLQDSGSFGTDPSAENIGHTNREKTGVKLPLEASGLTLPSERAKPSAVNTKNRLPGYVMSRTSTADSATTVSSLPPINTAVPRVPAPLDSRAATPGSEGVISQLRSRLMSRDFWMRDENAKDCFHCGEPFTTFRRKHHCRTCGQIFDSKCTLLIPGTQFGQPGSIRVCKPCERMINAHEDDSSDFSDSEQSPVLMNPRISELSWAGSARPSVDDDDTASVISQSIDHVLRTPTMAIPATRRAGEGHNRRSAVLEINPERSLARPTSSRSLRSSLGTRPHSISHKRHHSRQQFIRSFKPYHDDRAPFQRRHVDDLSTESRLPAFHKDNIIDPDLAQYLSDDASSGDEQPSLLSAVTDSNLSKSGGDSEKATFGGLLAAMKKGRSAFGERGIPSIAQPTRDADDASISSSRAVNLPRSSRRRNLSVASSVHQRQSPRASKDSMFPQDAFVPPVPFPIKLREAGFKMTRSSSMRGIGASPVEVNKASLEHVRKLLRQLLIEASVPNEESWENALVPILLKTADEVDPDVQRGDDMDIRHYIKLKKIPGGKPGDTSYVSGLVFTKNLALKSMSRSIPCPNILILTFPLEYARQQQHFMSLEPVIRQEREFLENLVSRITALRPNLLLVENNVSGLALDLLEKARIATAYNVKPSVLEAVSRCTQTRIVTSMDKLLTTELRSDCSSFDVKTYVHSGRRKTYMYISGCPKELGCTIILRGAEESVLAQVKQITEFMVYVVYNLRLETCLMRDEFAKIPASPMEHVKVASYTEKNSNTDNEDTNESDPALVGLESSQTTEKPNEEPENQILAATETIEVPDNVPMPTYYDDLVQDYQTKILSTSPFVKFEPPYLLMRTREMERRLAYLKGLRDDYVSTGDNADEKAKPQKFILITPEMVHESPRDAPSKVKEVLRAAHDAEYDRVFYHYQTQKRQWEAYVAGNSNMFDPYSHQNIVVLYSLVCTITSVPCAGPDVFALEFYNEHGDDVMFEEDCTLGHFVQALCASANHVCGVNGCEKLMFEHHRQYVHGDAQLSVMLLPHASKLRGLQDTVLMWSVCKICSQETQPTLMSESTFKYSFGKYLELSFWGRNLHARAGVCPHDLQRDHYRYFGFKDVAVRIQYDKIHLLEIIVPRPRVTWKVDNDLRLRNEVYTRMESRLSKFMTSVVARLKGINVDSVVPELLEASKKEIDDLIKKAHEDHAVLVRQLQDKYNGSRYWEVIPLNEVFRAVQEKVVEWDTIFADFERNFFPSEKDIKRMATLQLKKIFLDKDATEVTEDPLHTPTDPEDGSSPVSEKPRFTRRMTLSPEKAQDVLVSVVEEHAGKKHRNTPQAVDTPPVLTPSEGMVSTVDAGGGKQASPQDKAVSQEEVRHLDLAVTSGQSEISPLGAASSPNLRLSSSDMTGESAEAKCNNESTEFSTPEAIDAEKDETSPDLPATPPNKPSAIPRLTEGAFRRSGKARSPPLLRTQSQPAHLVRDRSFGGKTSPLNLNDASSSRGEPAKSSDKKLTDRLGLSALKNARFASGHSLIPRSTPKRGSSHVSTLAKHFEQLSHEFEMERQRERRQRASGAQSRAFPLASSKPIVEVYRNVREAVEEREPPADGEEHMSSAPRHSMDDSSRRSDEFLDQKDQQPSSDPLSESPTESFEPRRIVQPDSQLMSEGEPEDNASDEDQNTADGLHPVDSHEEAKLPDDDSLEYKDLAKHERTTLLKMLTNFWSERSASGWTALDYPLTVMDHVFADCDIIVREDEPSSLISFALDSSDYKEKLLSIQQRYNEKEEYQEAPGSGPEALAESRVEHALLRATGTHLKYQFQEGQAKMLCKVFYAEQFDALRKKCGVADRIVESLSRCAKWDSKGGKTKSLFLKTLDDRFILKSLSPIETQAFLKFAPAYFQIMSEALFHELPSAIAKMFGFYQVIIKNPSTGTEFNWFLLLMENLFYDREPNRIFDLKGSMRNRKVQSTGERDEVLLDENMVDFIYETPLFAREHSKKLLGQSVWNDTLFLGRQNVMDYSLMVAIDEKRSELVVGIIDCIRTYTWDKKLESWIKDRGFAGSSRNRPTVTSPKEYKGRFREAMARYVLQAPRYVPYPLLPFSRHRMSANKDSCWHQFQPSAMYRQPHGDAQASHLTEFEAFDGNGEAGPLL